MPKFYPEMELRRVTELERDSLKDVEFCLDNLGVKFVPDLSAHSIDSAAAHARARPEDGSVETEFRESLRILLPFYIAAAIRKHTRAQWAVNVSKSSHEFQEAYLTGYGDCPWDRFYPSQARIGPNSGDLAASRHLEMAIEHQALATRVLEVARVTLEGAPTLAVDELMQRLVSLRLIPDSGSGPLRYKNYRKRVVAILRQSGVWKPVPNQKDVYAPKRLRSKTP
jgi:hypothetical protein